MLFATPTLLALASLAAPQIEWFEGPLTSALGSARHQRRSLAIYFWNPGSDHCARFWEESMQSAQGTTALEPYLCLSADISRSSGADLLGRFGVTTVPTLLVLGEDGTPEDGIVGFAPAAVLAGELQRIQSGVDTVGDLEQRIEAEQDLEARFSLMLRLSLKLGQLGQAAESEALLDEVRRLDPTGKTIVGSRLAFWEVRDAIQEPWLASGDPADLDLAPMQTLVKDLKHPVVRFEAYEWLAGRHQLRGEESEARKSMRAAWPDVPAPRFLEMGSELVTLYWDQRKDLSREEKQFAHDVAREVHDRARAELEAARPDDGSSAFDAMGEEDRGGIARAIGAMALGFEMTGERREARKLADEARAMAPGDVDLLARLDVVLN